MRKGSIKGQLASLGPCLHIIFLWFYNIFLFIFQDFVSHFHVLLPRNIIPSKFNIQDFFRKINLNSDNYQVGKSMVFLKEQERQHLQDLLHQEVLRRIILLQRWFRVLLCRQHFLHLRQASIIIQRYIWYCVEWQNWDSSEQTIK